MGKKPYRVEVTYPETGKPKYFLVKDVNEKGKRRKAKKYLGVVPLSKEDKDNAREKFAFEMEFKAAQKRAEINAEYFNYEYLKEKQAIRIETIRFVYKIFTELLTVSETDFYEEKFEVSYVQGTTSIEGNTINKEETYALLVDGIVPDNKTLREINEVQNFKRVKIYRDSYRGKVKLEFVKHLHFLIMNNIDDESAGTFRRHDDIGIRGCDLAVTSSILIVDELQSLIDDYYQKLDDGWNPFEAAVLFHYRFEMIHPFTDGNGRVGREMLNYMLMKSGYPRLLFLGEDRDLYIRSLKYGNLDEYSKMVGVFVFLIDSQRYNLLVDGLEKVVKPPKRTGQLRITDFATQGETVQST